MVKYKVNKWLLLKGMVYCLAWFLVIGCSAGTNDGQEKPNIVLILADDMGYGDVSGLNPESVVQTPNLDQMMESGIYFTEAHASASICTPTRYALLTGRYSFRTGLNGVLTGYSKPIIEYNRETVASLLSKAGYKTAIIGKWHLGLEWQAKDTTKPVYTRDKFIPDNLNVDYSKEVKGVQEIGFEYSYISPAGNNLAPFTFI
ncbi:MAG: sulfatase-like hydrolase/transferase [Balneolaceae bacterium]|nr:sulfatase-like hydrolase/transferase [Balneolaceae bacterium]